MRGFCCFLEFVADFRENHESNEEIWGKWEWKGE